MDRFLALEKQPAIWHRQLCTPWRVHKQKRQRLPAERTHKVAIATFWRTFHHDGKISPDEGGGAHPPPFTTSTITYKVVVYALAERTDTFPLLYPYIYSVARTSPLFLLYPCMYSVTASLHKRVVLLSRVIHQHAIHMYNLYMLLTKKWETVYTVQYNPNKV